MITSTMYEPEGEINNYIHACILANNKKGEQWFFRQYGG